MGSMGETPRVHPNDDVNLGQSSNDVFPTAMHLAVALQARWNLLPAMIELHAALAGKVQAFGHVVKVGRTHVQDATPIALGQEFGGYVAQLALCQCPAFSMPFTVFTVRPSR